MRKSRTAFSALTTTGLVFSVIDVVVLGVAFEEKWKSLFGCVFENLSDPMLKISNQDSILTILHEGD